MDSNPTGSFAVWLLSVFAAHGEMFKMVSLFLGLLLNLIMTLGFKARGSELGQNESSVDVELGDDGDDSRRRRLLSSGARELLRMKARTGSAGSGVDTYVHGDDLELGYVLSDVEPVFYFFVVLLLATACLGSAYPQLSAHAVSRNSILNSCLNPAMAKHIYSLAVAGGLLAAMELLGSAANFAAIAFLQLFAAVAVLIGFYLNYGPQSQVWV